MRRNVCLAMSLLVVLGLLLACSPGAPTAVPTKPAAPATPTAAPAAPTAVAKAPAAATTAPAAPAVAPKAPAPTLTTAPKIKRGGVLRSHDNLLPTLDTQISGSANTSSMNLLFDSLFYHYVDEKAGTFEIRPMLVEAWDVPEPRTMVFKLRKGVKFHDGSDWNAAVAKWNLERLRDNVKSMAKAELELIGRIDVVDDYTIKLNLKAPGGALIVFLTNAGSRGRTRIISKEAVEKLGDEEFGRRGVGSGPFKLAEWAPTDHIYVSRFDQYWEKGADGSPLPYLDRVEIRYIPEMLVALLEVRAGNLDLMGPVPSSEMPKVKSDPSLALWDRYWAKGLRQITFSGVEGPFYESVKLRQAVGYAIDNEAVAKAMSVAHGIFEPAYYFWAEGTLGYDEASPRFRYDPAKAKALLAEAGYPDGLPVRESIMPGHVNTAWAEVLQQMLGAVGMRLTINQMERVAWMSHMPTGKGYDFGPFTAGYYPDPDGASRNLVSTSVANWSSFNAPDQDRCMEEGRSTYDPKQRHEIYKRCTEVIFNNAWIIPQYAEHWYWAHKAYVKGLTTEWELWDARYAWLDK